MKNYKNIYHCQKSNPEEKSDIRHWQYNLFICKFMNLHMSLIFCVLTNHLLILQRSNLNLNYVGVILK